MRNVCFKYRAQLICITEHLDYNAGLMLHNFYPSFMYLSAYLPVGKSWFVGADYFACLLIGIFHWHPEWSPSRSARNCRPLCINRYEFHFICCPNMRCLGKQCWLPKNAAAPMWLIRCRDKWHAPEIDGWIKCSGNVISTIMVLKNPASILSVLQAIVVSYYNVIYNSCQWAAEVDYNFVEFKI